eukprot:3306713-Pleurochrysis_carterae.AAC.1
MHADAAVIRAPLTPPLFDLLFLYRRLRRQLVMMELVLMEPRVTVVIAWVPRRWESCGRKEVRLCYVYHRCRRRCEWGRRMQLVAGMWAVRTVHGDAGGGAVVGDVSGDGGNKGNDGVGEGACGAALCASPSTSARLAT